MFYQFAQCGEEASASRRRFLTQMRKVCSAVGGPCKPSRSLVCSNRSVLFSPVGGCVLSLCAGSGSMLEACLQLGRSCLGIEVDGMLN